MKIYTTRGDTGCTDLLGGRVTKADSRIDLLGELDETTSTIGFARSLTTREDAGAYLMQVQRDLYQIMAELAFIDTTRPDTLQFGADRVTWLEESIAQVQEHVTLPREFVLPGESVAGGALDMARTVARRAERRAHTVHEDKGTIANGEILRYLNRLSTLLFILARAEDTDGGEPVVTAKRKA